MAKQFSLSISDNDPVFDVVRDVSVWKGIVGDPNVAAQEDGVDALVKYLEFASTSDGVRCRSLCVPILAEKGLGSSRAGTKQKSLTALLLFVEIDAPGTVLEDLVTKLNAKSPKVVAALVWAIKEIYRNFGVPTVDPKVGLKHTATLFGHADKNVRNETSALTIELFRWLGEAIMPSLSELKPVQLKELKASFADVDRSNVQPERRLRSAIAKGSASSASKPDADALAFSQPAQADAFDLSEPVDVLSKIPESFSELLDSPKWNERKQALEELKAIASVPRIKNDNFSDLVLQLAKCLQDANLFVVTVAAQCVAVLANGLRSDFTKYRSMLMQPAMDKLKEKKASVVEALGSALDGLFLASGISDILEDALKYSANKNPQIKTETLKFLTRSLRSTRVAPSNTDAKSIAEAGVQCLRDTIEHVRTAAAELLGTLMKIMGERFLAASLDGLDDLRKNKIKEFYEAAEVNAKAGALPPVQAKGRTVTGSRPTSRASVAPSSDSDAPRSRTSINPSRSSMAPSSLRVPRPSSASHSPGLKSSASASNTTSSSLEAPRLAQSSRTLVSRVMTLTWHTKMLTFTCSLYTKQLKRAENGRLTQEGKIHKRSKVKGTNLKLASNASYKRRLTVNLLEAKSKTGVEPSNLKLKALKNNVVLCRLSYGKQRSEFEVWRVKIAI